MVIHQNPEHPKVTQDNNWQCLTKLATNWKGGLHKIETKQMTNMKPKQTALVESNHATSYGANAIRTRGRCLHNQCTVSNERNSWRLPSHVSKTVWVLDSKGEQILNKRLAHSMDKQHQQYRTSSFSCPFMAQSSERLEPQLHYCHVHDASWSCWTRKNQRCRYHVAKIAA